MADLKKKLSAAHLYWLLASLALVMLIHAPNLPIWVMIVSVLFGVWRYYAIKMPAIMPSRWLLIPMTIAVGLGILYSFHGGFGRDASLSLLVMMTALKLLETRAMRDYVLALVLGFFLTGNLFLFNQSIANFGLSLLPVILLTATFINISVNNQQPIIFYLKLAGKLLLQSVPIMLVLFVLFPRIPGPLWGVPQDAFSAMTGLGEGLEFGSISQLTKNSAIAFRVQFKGKIPAQNQLYWRGPVLWHQDGNQWLMPSKSIGLAAESLTTAGEKIDYTITLEPHNRLWLLLLDMPNSAPNDAKLTHDYSAVANNPVRTRIRYDASSYSQYQLGVALDEREKTMSLQIHEDENPRSKKLAASWAALSSEQKVNNALQMFRKEAFIYTLRPPRLGKDGVDAFLFDSKKGFCEHYATSFVYLMRAAGVPARIVTGYQGGELNPNGNYLIVRQSDAHAWAEVWLENRGWVRVDPTAAVSPERIEQSIGEALSEIDELPFMARHDFPLIKKAFLNWDSVNNGWNQWVLGYDDVKQLAFLKQLTGKDFSLQDLLIWLIAGIGLAMAATTYFLLKQNKRKLSAVQKCYADYLTKLKPFGLAPKTGEGALDFGQRAANVLPQYKTQIMTIAEEYNALQYSIHAPSRGIQQLSDLVNNFKLSKNDAKN
jgi:protein-glutamine gamma-glutamyltransferase